MKNRILFSLAFALVAAAAEPQAVTLDDILGAPFPSSLTAAPSQGKIAWTQDAEGRKSVWVAVGPQYQARAIVSFGEDDGQEITDVQFGPGANHVVFVRVLLIHGDDDRNVPFSESVDLAEALTKQGVPYEELVFPDEVHDFLLHRNWKTALEAVADFLERKLVSRRETTQ